MLNMPALIAKKRDGKSLSHDELGGIIDGYLNGQVPDYQVSALLMAICFQGMTDEETFSLSDIMARSGDQLDLSGIAGVKVDKHSTGGVGDKTSLIVLPLAAACGVKVAKLSGRGLGHTGGTLDKLDAIPGFRSDLSEADFLRQANDLGLVLAGQTANLVPADKKLYALRDVTATVDSIPLIASSVMSKKLASGADAIVLDVKCGSGAFMKTQEESVELARLMCRIGEAHGKPTTAFITSMSTPLGRAVGNAVEVNEAVQILRNEGPRAFTELCIELAAEMLRLSESLSEGAGRAAPVSTAAAVERVRAALESGEALDMFVRWIEAQGGDSSFVREDGGLPLAPYTHEYRASSLGYLKFVDVEGVGLAGMSLGAGRLSLEQSIDLGAGIYFAVMNGEAVEKGQVIARLYSSEEGRFEEAAKILGSAIEIVSEKVAVEALILDKITS